MQSQAATVAEYLASLPEDRRSAIKAVRAVILANLDKDYEEGMQYGMIGYYIPHRVYPPGYHCDPKQPLPFAGLASQKDYISIYLMSVYGDSEQARQFQEEWAKTGKKLNMGKSCIRIKKLADLPLEVIGRAIARVPARKYLDWYEAQRRSAETRKSTSKSAARLAPEPGTNAKVEAEATTKATLKPKSRTTPAHSAKGRKPSASQRKTKSG